MNNRILNFLKGMAKDSNGEFPELTESEITTLAEGLVADYEKSMYETYVVNVNGKEIIRNAVCKDSSDCIAFNEMKDYYKGDKPSEVKKYSVTTAKVLLFLIHYI